LDKEMIGIWNIYKKRHCARQRSTMWMVFGMAGGALVNFFDSAMIKYWRKDET